MTVLEWDKPGERSYQLGTDRGVLYLADGSYAAWNGLTGLDSGNNSELKSYYLDGVKYLETVTPGEFVGKLKAFTYPDEFDRVVGISESQAPGLYFHEQPNKKFHLTYRTQIGNDTDPDYGYKLNLLYNLSAIPESAAFGTIQQSVEPMEFSWSLTGVPPLIEGHRPTCHISIDSRDTEPSVLSAIERILYGTSSTHPRMPSISEVESIFKSLDALLIVDNGDGTWTATETLDGSFISMLDSNTFEISDVDVTRPYPYVYEITDMFSHYTDDHPTEQIILKASDDSFWSVTATNDGTLDVDPSVINIFALSVLNLRASDLSMWAISATSDGTLEIASTGATDLYLDQIQLLTPSGDFFTVTATADGHLDIS